MTESALELASLLCSRLCHDLMSPVGALSNGLELLAEETDPQMRQSCLELVEASARSSADKLRFFRLAFGAAGGFGEAVPCDEPRAVIVALAAPRIAVNWQIAAAELPKGTVKVLLNLALIAIEALPRGGTLDLAIERPGAASEIAVRAAGPRITFDPAVGEALQGRLPAAALSARTAPGALVALLAAAAGGHAQFVADEGALVLGALLPQG